jgi:hypothetical protein
VAELRLDDDTVDRILAGLVDPVDAPPGFEAAVTLLAAARGAAVPPVAGVARPAHPAGRLRPRVPILAAALVLGCASGAAYAAGLPAAASSTARDVVRSLERSSGPRTHPVSGRSPGRGLTGSADTGTTAVREARARPRPRHGPPPARRPRAHHAGHGHGPAVSALARSTSGTAGVKGATISAAASGGKSHVGEHGHNGKGHASHGDGHGRGHGLGRPR